AVQIPRPDGSPCATTTLKSVCIAGICGGCRSAADCHDGQPCTEAVCAPTGKLCHHWPRDGDIKPAPTETPGDCLKHRCVFGEAKLVADDTDVPLPAK